MSKGFTENSDDAISGFAEDLLGRSPFVDRLAAILKAAPEHSSNVFALYGEWGSGKTSVKNLLLKRFSQKGSTEGTPLVVEFNPWEFSSQGELLKAFFSEVAKALGRQDAGAVAVAMARLGSYFAIGATALKSLQVATDVALIPGGGVIGLGADMLAVGGKQAKDYSALLKEGKLETLKEVRADLQRALLALERSVLIVIDDIDRLPPPQVVQLLQVVRANASLPKLNFLLLIDQASIVRSLVSEKFSSDYLEKIVQFAINLPALSQESLREFTEKGLRQILTNSAMPFEWDRWRGLYDGSLADFLSTPRKIRRLLHTFRFHLAIFVDDDTPEVDLVDLFCLEVLRLYLPTVWEALSKSYADIFGGFDAEDIYSPEGEDTKFDKRMKVLVELAPKELQPALKKLLSAMFPKNVRGDLGVMKLLSTRRICTDIHFPTYFLLSTNEAYPTHKELATAQKHLGDGKVLLTKLKALANKYDYRRLIATLQPDIEGPLAPASIRNLLAATWRLAEEDFKNYGVSVDVPIDTVTETFTGFLLSQVGDEAARLRIATEAFDQSRTLFPLLRFTAHEQYTLKNNPHEARHLAFTEESLKSLQQTCLASLAELARKGRLKHHPRLGAIMSYWRSMQGESVVREWVNTQLEDDEALVAIVLGLVGVSISSGPRSSAPEQRRHYFISRASAERVFTLDEKLRARVEKVDRSTLKDFQILALNELLRNIDQKAKGIEEADYGIQA